MSAVLDSTLDEFLRGSGEREISNPPVRRSNKVPNVEGVWITTHMGIQKLPCPASSLEDKTEEEEEEDLIWWSWDGKLLGFTDW